MLTKTQELIEELHVNRINYCHWKSNLALAESLAGKTDIDLLVQQQDVDRFRTILSQLCFQPAITTNGESFPSVEHYYALDEETGALVHVHAYYRVITGESLTKNYHLPIEEKLLRYSDEIDSVPVPIKSAELVVFTLRIMLKHTSLVELLLLSRYWKQARQEIEWLLEPDSLKEAMSFVEQWLPVLSTDLFSECVMALKTPAPLFRRIALGHRLRSQLRPYARHSAIQNKLAGIRKFTTMFFQRLSGSQKGMALQNGGSVIAFVGSEATGKSTLLAEVKNWLGEHFSVKKVHTGKPRSTPITLIPNLFLPALRSIFPRSRTTHMEIQNSQERQSEQSTTSPPLAFVIRSVLLAYDRHSLLVQASDQAANRTIVLCDRYPSSLNGAPDSPQLSHLASSPNGDPFRHKLANFETQLYREIPPPDLVIYLKAPLEVTLDRNAARGKKEPEEYVRRRHASSSNLPFGKTTVCEINTDQPFDQTILQVKRAIWSTLYS